MHSSIFFRFLTSTFQHCKPAERTILLDVNVGTFTKQNFTEEQSLLKSTQNKTKQVFWQMDGTRFARLAVSRSKFQRDSEKVFPLEAVQ